MSEKLDYNKNTSYLIQIEQIKEFNNHNEYFILEPKINIELSKKLYLIEREYVHDVTPLYNCCENGYNLNYMRDQNENDVKKYKKILIETIDSIKNTILIDESLKMELIYDKFTIRIWKIKSSYCKCKHLYSVTHSNIDIKKDTIIGLNQKVVEDTLSESEILFFKKYFNKNINHISSKYK